MTTFWQFILRMYLKKSPKLFKPFIGYTSRFYGDNN